MGCSRDNRIQECLDDNDISIYSTYNEGKSVIAERFIRTIKSKIYKKITANLVLVI